MKQKVYVINPSDPRDKGIPSDAPAPRPDSTAPDNSQRAKAPVYTNADRWAHVLRSYLLGPIALVLWPDGRFRFSWAVLGAGSVVASVYLLLSWSSFRTGLQTTSNGALLWIVIVSVVILTTATAWSRAVARAGKNVHAQVSILPPRLRRPAVVGALGIIFPGFGLLVTGHFKRAACVLWTVGLLVASGIILANWSWLWSLGESFIPAGISGTALEMVFIVSACIAVLVLFILIVQALDGARRFSPATPSRVFADAIGVSLVVAVALFATTFRPVAFGQSLSALSIALHRDGFRLIPLGLCEAASRLDPATPAHLANAAIINDELGMEDAANAKRRVLERRMNEYVDVMRYDKQAGDMSLMLSSIADNPLEPMADTPIGGTWAQIRGMFRTRTDWSTTDQR